MIAFTFLFFLVGWGQAATLNIQESGPETCLFLHCPVQVGACVLDTNCMAILTCMQDCNDRPDGAQCMAACEWTIDTNNLPFKHLLDCMLKHDCMEHLPDDGTCLAGPEDTLQDITQLDQVGGSWWVVRGLNCGQDDLWTGAYDWLPCQHGRYLELEDGGWINNTTFCGGTNSSCTTQQIVTAPAATMASPGVIRLEYDDVPLLPQVERWHVVAWPEPDFIMVIWCGQNPVVNYNGGFILSRGRTQAEMLPSSEEAFRASCDSFGIDYDAMCVSDNSLCPEEP